MTLEIGAKGKWQRRQLLQFTAAAAVVAVLPLPARAESEQAKQALVESDLIYLSPVKRDGSLSSCQAEVWFVTLGPSVYVCTATDSWRSQAVGKGVNDTHIWVGDRGVWKRNRYQSLPTLRATANIESDPIPMGQALDEFGRKYSSEWSTWGPRFANGLKDGSRTMLRYDVSG